MISPNEVPARPVRTCTSYSPIAKRITGVMSGAKAAAVMTERKVRDRRPTTTLARANPRPVEMTATAAATSKLFNNGAVQVAPSNT